MFDLFRSRDKAVRFLLSGVLMVVALSMVAYLIPGYGGSGGGSANENIVAEVGKDKVTVRDVQQALQNAQRGRQITSELMQFYAPQMIEQLITERAVAYQAARMGFEVTDADIANGIRTTLPSLFPEGKFVGKEAYISFLAQQNVAVQEFEEDMRRQLLLNRLRSSVLESIVVSNTEIEEEFRRRNEKATVEYVKLTPDKFRGSITVTPEEIRKYYDQNQGSFKIPEKRAIKLLILDQAKLEQAVQVSDQQLRRAYEQNLDRYRTPERVHARHILLKTTDKSKEEEAKIKAKAEDLLKQVKGGADFAELAKKNSEDPGSGQKGGDLDWIVRGQTVPEFEKTAFSLKPKEISGLVKTQYGYHIIQVLEHEQPRVKPLEEVKSQLLAEERKQRASAEMQSTLDAAVQALKKDPQQIEQVARTYNLSVITVDKAGPGDPIPEIGVNKDFEDALTPLKKGEVSQAVSAPGNRAVFALITDVFPAHNASFEEALEKIRPLLVNSKAAKLVEDRAKELLDKTKAMNGDLKKAAKSMGFEVTTSTPFTRNGAIEGLGSSDSIPEAFTKPAGTLFGPLMIAEARIAGKVVSRIEPDMSQLKSQTDSLRDEIRGKKGRERNVLFEDGIRAQLAKEGKLRIHKDVVIRIINTYRG